MYPVYNARSSAVPSGSYSQGHQRSTDMGTFDYTQHSAASQQSTTSLSGQGAKLPIPKLSSSTASNGPDPKPLFWCEVPDCPQAASPFTRSGGVKRHFRTCHAQEPFWRCNVCGHWEPHARRDKMWEHCRKIHDHDPAEGEYPCHSVQSVGAQNHVARVSTNGKRTRRSKRRLT